MGFEPTILSSLDECSATELYTKAAQLAGPKEHVYVQMVVS